MVKNGLAQEWSLGVKNGGFWVGLNGQICWNIVFYTNYRYFTRIVKKN